METTNNLESQDHECQMNSTYALPSEEYDDFWQNYSGNQMDLRQTAEQKIDDPLVAEQQIDDSLLGEQQTDEQRIEGTKNNVHIQVAHRNIVSGEKTDRRSVSKNTEKRPRQPLCFPMTDEEISFQQFARDDVEEYDDGSSRLARFKN